LDRATAAHLRASLPFSDLGNHREAMSQLKTTAAKQEATIAEQQNEIKELAYGLEKISSQVQLIEPAPQMVFNSQ
jgi:hypothetical protein